MLDVVMKLLFMLPYLGGRKEGRSSVLGWLID